MDDLADFGDHLVPAGLDSNGYPTFRGTHDGIQMVLHVVDVPLSDITDVRGIRCTTPIRTVIDCASSLSLADVRSMITSGLQQLLFTDAELRDRLAQPDLAEHPGAAVVRALLGAGPCAP